MCCKAGVDYTVSETQLSSLSKGPKVAKLDAKDRLKSKESLHRIFHGGGIGVVSWPPRGGQFYLSLP